MNAHSTLKYIAYHLDTCAERSLYEPNSLLIKNLQIAAKRLDTLLKELEWLEKRPADRVKAKVHTPSQPSEE